MCHLEPGRIRLLWALLLKDSGCFALLRYDMIRAYYLRYLIELVITYGTRLWASVSTSTFFSRDSGHGRRADDASADFNLPLKQYA